jgi:Mrp family chromosome partitioning ATPase
MKTYVRFDDALPRFARSVGAAWGVNAVQSNIFLRDASGHLTFVVLDEGYSSDARRRLSKTVEEELQAYVDGPTFAIATPDELFDESLRAHPDVLTISLANDIFTGNVKLIDRRMVGGDWLRTPTPDAGRPVRFVFASLKGGVGRSTALCVVAAELAKTGKRVLAIDMDLEAPGLGTFLLSEETLPEFGLLDFLVESEIGQTMEGDFFADMVSASWLSGGLGRVDVIPAIGRRSISNPENVLAKIARAYLADGVGQGSSTFQDRMAALVSMFSDPARYDLILIDARAGLHETTAAALLGLGADVLLFGLDQSQTFDGYKLLFSHLSTLPSASISGWRDRLTVVQGKAPVDSRQRAIFSEKMQDVIGSCLSPVSSLPIDDASALSDTFEVQWADTTDDPLIAIRDAQETQVIAVYEDAGFRSFDPALNPATLSSPLYSAAYVELLSLVRDRLADLDAMEAK